VINVQPRETAGKGAARSLRRDASIPAVIYREGKSQSLSINRKEMVKFIRDTHGEQVIVNVTFPDKSVKKALLKTYQLDPIRGDLLHADFFEVSMTEKVKLNIPIVTTGEAVGIKRDKGVLQHARDVVEVECLPDNIPGHLEVDISALEIGQSAHVSDIMIPEGVKVLTDSGETILLIATPALAVEVEEGEEAEEGAEPEVEKKGKEEEAASEES
jgi:large subunit ribosomal protein L25